jgi:hypothetical protein
MSDNGRPSRSLDTATHRFPFEKAKSETATDRRHIDEVEMTDSTGAVNVSSGIEPLVVSHPSGTAPMSPTTEIQ